jgi:hypothetical protein
MPKGKKTKKKEKRIKSHMYTSNAETTEYFSDREY